VSAAALIRWSKLGHFEPVPADGDQIAGAQLGERDCNTEGMRDLGPEVVEAPVPGWAALIAIATAPSARSTDSSSWIPISPPAISPDDQHLYFFVVDAAGTVLGTSWSAVAGWASVPRREWSRPMDSRQPWAV
jgi:hypothetical protein